jgi:hypothetical protein
MGCWKWVREAISDEAGMADIAYIAIGALTTGALGSLAFISLMSAIAYFQCTPLVKPDVVVNCIYDPLPMGQAAGLIFGAFGALIASLAGYMVATRTPRAKAPDQTVIAPAAQVVHQVAPAEAATDVGPTVIGKARKR